MSFRLGRLPALQVAQTRSGRLGYVVSGRESPSIVLFNGAGVSLEGWRALYPGIESIGRVFAWNRFGIQGSDAPRSPQTGTAVIAALRELLVYAGMEPPYVIVAHSLGGLYANLFARLHPADVRAMLLVEATHPADQEMLKKHEGFFTQGISRMLQLPARLFRRNVHEEIECLGTTVREIGSAPPFPAIPLSVVTGGRAPPAWMMSPAAVGARRANQQDLARLSPRGEQVIAQASGHFPQLTEPELVLQVLGRLARA